MTSSSVRWEVGRQERLSAPEDQALSLIVALDEGDPWDIQGALLELAEVQSGIWGCEGDPRPEMVTRMEALLPASGDLPLLVLHQATQLLELGLRVVTSVEVAGCKKAWSQGGMGKLRHSPLHSMDPFDIIPEHNLGKASVAVAYLTACVRSGDENRIQVGLRNLIEWQKGRMGGLAKKLGMRPEAIYEMISGVGYPKVTGFLQIIRELGFELFAEVPHNEAAKSKAAESAAKSAKSKAAKPKAAKAAEPVAEAACTEQEAALAG